MCCCWQGSCLRFSEEKLTGRRCTVHTAGCSPDTEPGVRRHQAAKISTIWAKVLPLPVVSSTEQCWHRLTGVEDTTPPHRCGPSLSWCWFIFLLGRGCQRGKDFFEPRCFLPIMNVMVSPGAVSSSWTSQCLLPLLPSPLFAMGFGALFGCWLSCKGRSALTVSMVLPYFG